MTVVFALLRGDSVVNTIVCDPLLIEKIAAETGADGYVRATTANGVRSVAEIGVRLEGLSNTKSETGDLEGKTFTVKK